MPEQFHNNMYRSGDAAKPTRAEQKRDEAHFQETYDIKYNHKTPSELWKSYKLQEKIESDRETAFTVRKLVDPNDYSATYATLRVLGGSLIAIVVVILFINALLGARKAAERQRVREQKEIQEEARRHERLIKLQERERLVTVAMAKPRYNRPRKAQIHIVIS